MQLEVACFNLQSCLIAQEAGADRIELCEDYNVGGITPSDKLIVNARAQLKVPLHVIIRPRAGNFLYTNEELTHMERAIGFCKEQKIDGVVFGILDENKAVNASVCRKLVKAAGPMNCTFHRAIDTCADPAIQLPAIIDCGFNRVLSSGGKQNALAGAENLKEMIGMAGTRLTVMPGGGIRSSNISDIYQITGAKEFHSAAMNVREQVPDKREIIKMKQMSGA